MPRPKGATAAAKAAKPKVNRTPEWYAEIGKRGGTRTKELHGPEFYATIGRKGADVKNWMREQRNRSH